MYLSGQGSKVCPYTNLDVVRSPHTHANREALKLRLQHDQATRLEGASPWRDVFNKTAAFISALRNMGCSGPACEITQWLPEERSQRDTELARRTRMQRGYRAVETKCDGRLLFNYDQRGSPYIQ
jgi:hypothetical protein